MDGVSSTFLDEGVLGAIIVVLGFVVVSLYKQNQTLQRETRDTLREVIPAVAALDKALDYIQRGGN